MSIPRLHRSAFSYPEEGKPPGSVTSTVSGGDGGYGLWPILAHIPSYV